MTTLWQTLVVLALRKLSQEGLEFETSLGYIVKPRVSKIPSVGMHLILIFMEVMLKIGKGKKKEESEGYMWK